MPKDATLYDLVLLLSTRADEDERAKLLAEVEAAIDAGGGSIERKQGWGTRTLTFPINHEADAEYHLLQFNGLPTLLESLSHSLRIADGVLRFRIIKVLRGTPAPPATAPPVLVASGAPASASASAAAAAPEAAEPEAAAAAAAPAPAAAPEGAGAEAAPTVATEPDAEPRPGE